jgi:ankyrin repeat protein
MSNTSKLEIELRLACKKNWEERVKELLEKGVNINSQNSLGYSPLHITCESGNFKLTKILLDNNPPPNLELRENEYGSMPIHLACHSRSIGIVRLLIEKGADVNAQESNGDTPLHIAARGEPLRSLFREEYLALIKLLLEKGANPHIRNNKRKTPRDLIIMGDYHRKDKDILDPWKFKTLF